jgi:D-alanyl-D-alanine carboxypeptidase/D-alanyl-D-alanine-endopeptidase (penicillin-binding protein 4)
MEQMGRTLREMGMRDRDFQLADGSGLSRKNMLTPALLTSVLMGMAGSAGAELEFASMLAAPGQEGTLRSRLRDPPYAGSVRAKTGYLNGVGALSGYATTTSGHQVAFSILVNDSHNPPGTYSMRETVDGICRAIVDHAR